MNDQTSETPYLRDMLREFRERLAELEPYVEEYRRLEIADRALGGETPGEAKQ